MCPGLCPPGAGYGHRVSADRLRGRRPQLPAGRASGARRTLRAAGVGSSRSRADRIVLAPERVAVAIRDAREAGQRFADKLGDSIRLHLRSDVPVGCALSGGLDSSAIAILVDRELQATQQAVNTFTSTFPSSPIDERDYADRVVRAIHGQPHYVTPSPDGFLEDLDRFVWFHDEPVGGLSIYASYCVARLTRQAGVPVVLNGQGGDEILSGYWQSYFMHLRHLAKRFRWMSLAGHFLGACGPSGTPGCCFRFPGCCNGIFGGGRPARWCPCVAYRAGWLRGSWIRCWPTTPEPTACKRSGSCTCRGC